MHDNRQGLELPYLAIVATSTIKLDQELLLDYGSGEGHEGRG